MKHCLLAQLDSKLQADMAGLSREQALTLAGLSISRLWASYEKWALENKAPKLVQWGESCVNTLWEQVLLEQLHGENFEQYFRCLEKIDGRLDRMYDQDIEVEGSLACPLLDALNAALCCFFDPKLLPGLHRSCFWSDMVVIVGQGAEYIYDTVFSGAGDITEDQLTALVERDPRWIAERRRIREDIALIMAHFQDKDALSRQKEAYMRINIFA